MLSPDVVQLADADLEKVNDGGAENIFFAGDSARASRTYRIVAKDAAALTLTLDGSPSFAGGNSEWHIPAGIGGVFKPFIGSARKKFTGQHQRTRDPRRLTTTMNDVRGR